MNGLDLDAIEQLIRIQMDAEMAADRTVVYWTEDTELGRSITSLSGEQNFYSKKLDFPGGLG